MEWFFSRARYFYWLFGAFAALGAIWPILFHSLDLLGLGCVALIGGGVVSFILLGFLKWINPIRSELFLLFASAFFVFCGVLIATGHLLEGASNILQAEDAIAGYETGVGLAFAAFLFFRSAALDRIRRKQEAKEFTGFPKS